MEVGEKFPSFKLKDEDGMEFDSSFLEGMRYVIYFYSRDNTAGCTKEAEEFSAAFPKLTMRNIPVIGVSKDSPESHRKFIDSKGLKVKLLSDPDHALMEQVGAWGEKKMYGKVVEGTIRSTFIIGRDGTVEAAWRNVKVTGHVDKVVDKAMSLSKNRTV